MIADTPRYRTAPGAAFPTVGDAIRAWLVVGLLCVVAALNYLDRNMIATMRLSIIAAVPMTDAQFGLLTSAFLWVYGLLSPLAGYLADRFGRSSVIIASLLVWSVLTWLTAYARTFEQLFIVRALMGVSEAAFIPGALALIADYHRGGTRSRANSMLIAGVMVGSGLGGMGGWLADRRGWTFPFMMFGLFGMAYAVLLVVVLRDVPAEVRNPRVGASGELTGRATMAEALVSLLPNDQYLRALTAWGSVAVAGWAIMGWAPTFFLERFHLSQGAAGLSVTGYFSGAGLAGVLLGGWLGDRWARKSDRARILLPAIGLSVAAPGVLLMSHASLIGLALAGIVVYGLTKNFLDANMMPILCQIADARYRATAYGMLNLCSCTIGGLGVYAGGVLRDAHIGITALYNFAVFAVAVSAVLLFSIKPAK